MTKRLKVLHLEDNLRDAELVQAEVENSGLKADVRVARSRTDFVNALERDAFDVILSDNNLPGFNSDAALNLARKKNPSIPFIFVSGMKGSPEIREKLLAKGATDYVSKSELNKLPEIIRRCVSASDASAESPSDWYVRGMERLVSVVQELSLARDLNRIMEIVRQAARELTGADGATFVLREGDFCHYADENAIEPLWKGRRFPINSCVSGWAMLNRQPAIIEDIYNDDRVPADAYRPTFVKSLLMVPIRTGQPIGAIGNYWAKRRHPRPEEVKLLQALADSTSVAMENVQLYAGLEQKVADRTARLQMLNEELEAFSYSVSHDLRAPLRHIIGYAGLVRQEAEEKFSANGRRYLATISEAAAKMSELIDALLAFSRMSRLELNESRVEMGLLVENVRRDLEPETTNRNIEWIVGELPAVTGDRALLKQVWANLLSNAVKYTRQRERAEIRIGAKSRGGEIEFFVQDNGAGFDEKYAQKLFGVFQRLHREDEFEGTGVGLANVRRIIARHGGRTWATAEVNKGATFYFTLPAGG
jgi:signal transduction histidine kinase/FixJ family two-component response regulator